MSEPLTANKKLAAFFRSQGVPKASVEGRLAQLSDADQKAILAGVGDDGVVTRAAVDAYEKALDEHRVKVREAAEKRESPRVEADEQKDGAPAEAIHPVEKAVTDPAVKSRKKPAK